MLSSLSTHNVLCNKQTNENIRFVSEMDANRKYKKETATHIVKCIEFPKSVYRKQLTYFGYTYIGWIRIQMRVYMYCQTV